jgi:hypothetical protein
MPASPSSVRTVLVPPRVDHFGLARDVVGPSSFPTTTRSQRADDGPFVREGLFQREPRRSLTWRERRLTGVRPVVAQSGEVVDGATVVTGGTPRSDAERILRARDDAARPDRRREGDEHDDNRDHALHEGLHAQNIDLDVRGCSKVGKVSHGCNADVRFSHRTGLFELRGHFWSTDTIVK